MLLTILSFLGSYVYALATVYLKGYPNSDCSGMPLLNLPAIEKPTCDLYHDELINDCKTVPGSDCDNLPNFPFCRNTDDPWIDRAIGLQGLSAMKYECEEKSEPPTPDPTAAACDDDLRNGDEDGIDCGGSCPTQCPAKCNTLDCGTSHYRKDDSANLECTTHECNINVDLNECCIARALCSTLPSCFNEVLISAADSTYCKGDTCNAVDDGDKCCAPPGTCADFPLCNNETQYLNNLTGLKCASEQCGVKDINTCCKNKQTCNNYNCDWEKGLVNVANDESIYCEVDDCDDDSEADSKCCESAGSCSTFTCDDRKYLDRSEKDTLFCRWPICDSDDWSVCCDEKKPCWQSPSQKYTCSDSATHELSPDAENLFCNGLKCESPRDDAFCCIATPSPTKTPTPEPVAPPVETSTPAPDAPVETPTLDPSAPPVETSTPEPTPTPDPDAPVETPTPAPVAPVETPTPGPVAPSVETPTLEAVAPVETPTLKPDVIESQPCGRYIHCNRQTQYVNTTATCSGSPCDPTDADVCCIDISAPTSSDSGLSIGIIIVIVIAAVIFIAVVSVAVFKVHTTKGQTKGALIEM